MRRDMQATADMLRGVSDEELAQIPADIIRLTIEGKHSRLDQDLMNCVYDEAHRRRVSNMLMPVKELEARLRAHREARVSGSGPYASHARYDPNPFGDSSHIRPGPGY